MDNRISNHGVAIKGLTGFVTGGLASVAIKGLTGFVTGGLLASVAKDERWRICEIFIH
jgi:hypothetical protein